MNASRILANILSAEVEVENIPLYDLTVTEKSAKEITTAVCGEFGLKTVPVILDNTEKTKTTYFTRGGYRYKRVKQIAGVNSQKEKITLYAEGHNVGVLLHEIAHQEEYNHSHEFFTFNMKLVKWFKETLKEKFFPSIETIIENKKQEKPDMKKMMKMVIDELVLTADNGKIKMKEIGSLLLDEGLNTAENIQTVKNELTKKGIKVTV